jgi:transcriptional regulator with XRE-family HTH domain
MAVIALERLVSRLRPVANSHAMSRNDAEQSVEDVHARVSSRLRALRTERGLTLTQVAAAAGMDASTLSRLESGARRLTLDHLPTLARALGVRTDDLLAAPTAKDPRVRSAPMIREGMTFWRLNQGLEAPGQLAFKIRLPVDRRQPDPRAHEGHDWLYVLSGRLRLVLGAEEFVLGPGGAAEFSTWTPHWMGVVEEVVELIAIFGPHGERVHVLPGLGREVQADSGLGKPD